MRKLIAVATACSLSLALTTGCTPDRDDDVDVSLDPVVIDTGNTTSSALTPGGNMTSSALTPGGNTTSSAMTPGGDLDVVTEVPE